MFEWKKWWFIFINKCFWFDFFVLSEEDKDSELLLESDILFEESVECRNVEVKLTVKINEF